MVLQTMKNFSTQGIAFMVTIHFSLLNLDLLGGSNYLKKINFLLQEKKHRQSWEYRPVDLGGDKTKLENNISDPVTSE